MYLFKKKWDYKKDSIWMGFILEKKQYSYYYSGKEISYKYLNRRTKKNLDDENKKLKDNPILMEEKIKESIQAKKIRERSDYLEAKGYSCESFEYSGDGTGTMSKEMESFLTNLTTKEKVLIGIHRVGGCTFDGIKDILINGLIISGHLGSGVVSSVSLSDNVSYYPDNKTIIKELMYADLYKGSEGSILIEIPDEDLEKEICFEDENGFKRLNPKYIIGFVPVEENHHISKIIKANDFKLEETVIDIDNQYLYNYDFYSDLDFNYEEDETNGLKR